MSNDIFFVEVRAVNGDLVRQKQFPNYREAQQYATRRSKPEAKLGNTVNTIALYERKK